MRLFQFENINALIMGLLHTVVSVRKVVYFKKECITNNEFENIFSQINTCEIIFAF